MTEGLRVLPIAYVLLRRVVDGRVEVLLQQRVGTEPWDGHWSAGAAGHVERGESVFAAARREAREELGVEVGDLVPLCTVHEAHPAHTDADERVDTWFACDRWAGRPEIREPSKTAALAWAPLEAPPSPVPPHESLVLGGLRRGDLPPVLALGFDAAAGLVTARAAW